MERVVLVGGNGVRFRRSVHRVVRYLQEGAQIDDIVIIRRAGIMKPKTLKTRLSEALQNRGQTATLLVYNGHGGEGCWGYGAGKIEYSELVPMLQRVGTPLLVFNDCCHAYSLAQEMEKCQWAHPTGVIAASPADEVAYPCFTEVIKSWGKRKVYTPEDYPYFCINLGGDLPKAEQVILTDGRIQIVFPALPQASLEEIEAENTPCHDDRPRWGAELDRHFFPRQYLLPF